MKNKRLISIILAALMLLSLTAAAMADGEGTDSKLTGNPDIVVKDGSFVIVSVDSSGTTVTGTGGSCTMTVDNITVTDSDVHSTGTAPVVHGDVKADYEKGVAAKGSGSSVTVEGSVTATLSSNSAYAVWAENGGSVTVTGDATGDYGAYAEGTESSVTVYGDATGVDGSGACATNGATITVGGTAAGTSNGAFARGTGSSVTVHGDAKATGKNGKGAYAEGTGSSVTVYGDAEATGENGIGVYAKGSKVFVGGNASGTTAIDAANYNGHESGMEVTYYSTVIVEGTAKGNISKDNQNYSEIYVGALADGYGSQAENLTGFLVGLANDGNKVLDITEFFDISDASGADTSGTVIGDAGNGSTPNNLKKTASGRKYYVASADFDPSDSSETKSITLKLNSIKKQEGKTAQLTGAESLGIVSDDGETFTISYNSLGGMNALVLMFAGNGNDDDSGDNGGGSGNNGGGSGPSGGSGSSSGSSGSSGGASYVVVMPHTLEPSAGGRGMTLKCNTVGGFGEAEIAGALTVMVDFKVVDESCYTAVLNEKGNIEISFTDEFLATLSGGVHMASVIINNLTYTSQIKIPFV